MLDDDDMLSYRKKDDEIETVYLKKIVSFRDEIMMLLKPMCVN